MPIELHPTDAGSAIDPGVYDLLKLIAEHDGVLQLIETDVVCDQETEAIAAGLGLVDTRYPGGGFTDYVDLVLTAKGRELMGLPPTPFSIFTGRIRELLSRFLRLTK